MISPKRFVFVAPLLIQFLASGFSSVALGTEEASAPACKIEHTLHDAGEIFAGQLVRCTFPVKNTGQGVLQIAVRTSCGCTVARFDEVIQPGDEGKIAVQWKLNATREGRSAKTIEVTTNDPKQPRIQLALQATVVPAVRVLQGDKKTILLGATGPTRHEILVETRGLQPTKIATATTSVSYASVEVHPYEERKDKTRVQKLSVTIDASAPMGRSDLRLVLAMDSSNGAVSELRFICEKGISVSKGRVVLRAGNGGSIRPVPATVTLSKREGRFHVTRVETGDLNLEVELKEILDAQEFLLMLSAPSGPNQRGTVRIHTDDPEQPVIEINAFCLASR